MRFFTCHFVLVIWLHVTEIYYGKVKVSIKHFKGFRNVRKSTETSGDISVL